LPTGPRTPRSTVLSIEDEAAVARVSPPHAAAAGRLLARASADHPASKPLGLASAPTAPLHLAPARSRRRQARQEALQTVPIGYFHIRCPAGDCEAICREGI
jgi:hypothetical protein